MASKGGVLGGKTARSFSAWTTVTVRIVAETRYQLDLAAKAMGVELRRVRSMNNGIKTAYFGTGTRKVEVK
ncbi:hypothetical protein [Nitrospira sp. BLG_2]|uniref:hypothetical protein n=1 Tax=Nitrospira sp. BLG_2 TaxID=3397507 RepID=UPI003B9C9218